MNFYEVLELRGDASMDDIERAFRRLARKVHPDLNAGDAVKAEARMKLLNEIRDTLTDPLLRAGYDERLRLEALQRAAEAPARAAASPRARTTHAAPPTASAGSPDASADSPDEPRRRAGPILLAFGGALLAGVLFFLREPRRAQPADPPDEPAPAEPASRAPPPVAGPAPAPRVTTPGGFAPLLPPSGLTVPIPRPRPGGAPRGVGTTATLGGPRGPFRGRGIVRIGSTTEQVLRILGPPDSVETGDQPGDAVLHYGQLRLQMKNGRVTGGDAAAR